MATRIVVAAVLLHGVSLAHRDSGDAEQDSASTGASRQNANLTTPRVERSTIEIANASAAEGLLAGFLATPGLGSSLMQLSGTATAGLSANLSKAFLDACKVQANASNSHAKVQSLEKCAGALAELADKTRTERDNSITANLHYRDDVKLAHQLLKLLEDKTSTQKKRFEEFRENEKTAMESLKQKLEEQKLEQAASLGGLVQTKVQMRPIEQAGGSWPGGSQLGDPSFARRSRLVSAGMDAPSLSPEFYNGYGQPSFGDMAREGAELEKKEAYDAGFRAALATMNDDSPQFGTDSDWY